MVTVGFTVTATPLVAARLPGVMTPVPLEKTPVRLTFAPAEMELELAVKLEMAGGGGVIGADDPLPQPVKPAKPRIKGMASEAKTRKRFIRTTRCRGRGRGEASVCT